MLKEREIKELLEKYKPMFESRCAFELGDMNLGYQVRITYADPTGCWTNHDEINLGSKMLVERNIENEEEFLDEANYILGHEIQHIRSTVDKIWSWGMTRGTEVCIEKLAEVYKYKMRFNRQNDYDMFLKKLYEDKNIVININTLHELVHFIINSVCDGRIERIACQNKAGFQEQMTISRGKWWLENEIEEIKADEMTESKQLNIILNQLLCLSTMNIYQKGFKQQFKGSEIEADCKKIMPFIFKGTHASTCQQGMQQSMEIIKLLAERIAKCCEHEESELEKLLKDLIRNAIKAGLMNQDGQSSYGNGESNDGDKNTSITPPFGMDIEIDLTKEEAEKLKKENGDKNGNINVHINIIDEEEDNKPKQDSKSKKGSGSDKEDSSQKEDTESGKGSESSKEDETKQDSTPVDDTCSSNKEDKAEESSDKSSSKNSENSQEKGKNGKDNSQDKDSDSDSSKETDGDNSENKANSQDAGFESKDIDNKGDAPSNADELLQENSGQGSGSKSGACGDARDVDAKSEEAMIKEAMKKAVKAQKESIEAAKEIANPPQRKEGDAPNKPNGKGQPENIKADPNCKGVKNLYDYKVGFEELSREYRLDLRLPYWIKAKSDTFKRKISDLLKNMYHPAVRCQRSGIVDASMVHKLALKNSEIFMKRARTDKFSGCCYILVDNSGSMGYGKNSKREYAWNAVAEIEAGYSLLMPLKIVAFDACSYVYHEIVKDWDEILPNSGAYNFMMQGRGGGGNMDGYSIAIATDELLRQRGNKKLLIVLSDGAPDDKSKVKTAVEYARKNGVTVVGIYFTNVGYKPSAHEKSCFEKMYGTGWSTIVTTPENISTELYNAMRKEFL